ncbi:MAG: hypothetical protein ACRCWO_10130 [Bosea sp. (in: a-proteobacteria)]
MLAYFFKSSFQFLICAIALFCFSNDAYAQEVKSRNIVGIWHGFYKCAQGTTGLTLKINDQKDDNFSGFFNFYTFTKNDPYLKNPWVNDSCFSIKGKINSRNKILINPNSWITRPDGFEMVGLQGEIKLVDGSEEFEGNITRGAGCSTFWVLKSNLNFAVPKTCLK